MTKSELIKKITYGSDIMFDVRGKHYTILTWPDKGIAIGEQGIYEEPLYFDSAEDLVNHFMVDAVPLSDLCSEIVITDYTGNGREITYSWENSSF